MSWGIVGTFVFFGDGVMTKLVFPVCPHADTLKMFGKCNEKHCFSTIHKEEAFKMAKHYRTLFDNCRKIPITPTVNSNIRYCLA